MNQSWELRRSRRQHWAACSLLLLGGGACVPLEDLDSLSRGEDRAAAQARSEAIPLPVGQPGAPADVAVGGNEEAPTPSLEPPPVAVVSGQSPPDQASDAGDAGADAREDAFLAPPSLDATPSLEVEACAGTSFDGVCWYLGAPGASCNQTCGVHGGYREAATSYVGGTDQGGSPEDCAAVLGALGVAQSVRTTERVDGRGVGCHFFGTEDDPWWLSSPPFDEDAQLNLARQVCGCAR